MVPTEQSQNNRSFHDSPPPPRPGGLTTSDFENRNLFVVTEGQLNLTLAATHWMPTVVTTKNVFQQNQIFLGAALPRSGISVLVCYMKPPFPSTQTQDNANRTAYSVQLWGRQMQTDLAVAF